jgi:hypothetical protein
MNYGNGNHFNKRTCFHCSQPIADHGINCIQSDPITIRLAQALVEQLDAVYLNALLDHGHEPHFGSIMTGAVRARIGKKEWLAVSLSGKQAHRFLNLVRPGSLGKNVELVGSVVALDKMKSISGLSLSRQAHQLEQSRIVLAGDKAPANSHIQGGILPPAYPIGTCTGQKLLDFVFKKARAQRQQISEIALAEVFWKDYGHASHWKKGQVVPSCHACQYMLPIMLCDYRAQAAGQ